MYFKSTKCVIYSYSIMNPLSSTKMWSRVILPSAMYGCEVVGHISIANVATMERNQRLFARKVQHFHTSSHRWSTTHMLGLGTIEGYINKCKLLFIGRLLQANYSMVYKKMFMFLLTRFNNGIDIGNCISKDLFDILQL
jgi:hypothetical protein